MKTDYPLNTKTGANYKPKLLFTVVLILMLIYCSQAQAADKFPQRIISLAPANTEILYALNLGNSIIGVTSYCNYPPQAATKQKVGDFSHPNIETILSLKPDLILATGLEQSPMVDKLRQLNLRVVIIDPKNFNELFESITLIGTLTGTETYAYLLNESIKSRIGNVMKAIDQKKPNFHPRIFVEVSVTPLMTAARNTFFDEIITMLRGINSAADCPRPYCQVNEEFVIAQNPDFIILTSPQAKAYFTKRPAWRKVKAVQDAQLIDTIHPDILMRPGPRLVEAVEKLAQHIYGIKVR